MLVYSYCLGVRSSRVMERACRESLPYLFLTRSAAPSYRTLCTARTEQGELLEAVWIGLFQVAEAVGIARLGRITLDSTKLRAAASPEAVVTRDEYAALRAELERIQAEVARVDAQEAGEGSGGRTELGRTVPHEQMRDILRRVRRQLRAARTARSTPADPPPADPTPADPLEIEPEAAEPEAAEPEAVEPEAVEPLSQRMQQRIAAGLQALQEAEAEGRKHLCLTDPEARMMYGERQRGTRESYSFEVATDQGLLVAAQATQETHDNARLRPLVEAAGRQEPDGVQAVVADSGYYGGESVAALLRAGIDTCIPDSNTAADLHRGRPLGTTAAQSRGTVAFTYDAAADVYRCPEGNVLVYTQQRRHAGQEVKVYRAQAPCGACPLRSECLTQARAQHRTLKVGVDQPLLQAAQARFAEPAQQERYRQRGVQVEGVFGFLRGVLGFTHWWLRGAKKVECEAKLFKTAYQLRKLHLAWTG